MTPEQQRLREAVARALAETELKTGDYDKRLEVPKNYWVEFLPHAHAAIAVALEEAAKACEGYDWAFPRIEWNETGEAAAEFIRALIASEAPKP